MVSTEPLEARVLFQKLSILDRLLTPAILVAMIGGILIGVYVDGVQDAFDTVKFHNVSVPIAVGLIVMMWPVLTKVQYERLPALFRTKRLWSQILLSVLLNWLAGPLIMLALAWATLPDLADYRTGVIMVGLARCIAMVMIWNQLARGDGDYCAILVVINSVLQVVLYAPYALLFINVIGGTETVRVGYGDVAISVLIYLGIPLVAGVITRYGVWTVASKEFLDKRFLPYFGPFALFGLLYTIVVMFAYQGQNIVDNIGPVFRVFVPMILYFAIMWGSTFAFVYWLTTRGQGGDKTWGYEMAVVQSFTAGSNNFELAIAVAIAVYGVGSKQALAATIGPLVEVPVLLALTWVALWLQQRLNWTSTTGSIEEGSVTNEKL